MQEKKIGKIPRYYILSLPQISQIVSTKDNENQNKKETNPGHLTRWMWGKEVDRRGRNRKRPCPTTRNKTQSHKNWIGTLDELLYKWKSQNHSNYDCGDTIQSVQQNIIKEWAIRKNDEESKDFMKAITWYSNLNIGRYLSS